MSDDDSDLEVVFDNNADDFQVVSANVRRYIAVPMKQFLADKKKNSAAAEVVPPTSEQVAPMADAVGPSAEEVPPRFARCSFNFVDPTDAEEKLSEMVRAAERRRNSFRQNAVLQDQPSNSGAAAVVGDRMTPTVDSAKRRRKTSAEPHRSGESKRNRSQPDSHRSHSRLGGYSLSDRRWYRFPQGAVHSGVYEETAGEESENEHTEEEENSVSAWEDENRYFCLDCESFYEDECAQHPFITVVDNPAGIKGKSNYHMASLPDQLLINWSSIPNAGKGVFAKTDLDRLTKFGPYTGEITIFNPSEYEHNDEKIYSWEIDWYDQTKAKHVVKVVDGSKLDVSNWMRYVNNATSADSFNLVVATVKDEIYYVTRRDVKAGEELLTWYGMGYIDGGLKYRANLDEEKLWEVESLHLSLQGKQPLERPPVAYLAATFDCKTCGRYSFEAAEDLNFHMEKDHPAEWKMSQAEKFKWEADEDESESE